MNNAVGVLPVFALHRKVSTMIRKMLPRLIALVVLSGLIGNAHDVPSVFAAGCRGSGCNGKDPATTGCNSSATNAATAKIKDASGKVIGTVDLRWSTECKTNWGKLTAEPGVKTPSGVEVWLQDSVGRRIPDTVNSGNGPSIYGNMFYAPNLPLRACATMVYKGTACTVLR
jgi:hypothetical protein